MGFVGVGGLEASRVAGAGSSGVLVWHALDMAGADVLFVCGMQ